MDSSNMMQKSRSTKKNIPGLLLFAILWLLLLMLTPNQAFAQAAPDDANGDVVIVGQNDPNLDFQTIQDALDQAEDGDTITLDGVFDLSGCGGALLLKKNITITGTSNPNDEPSNASQVHGCGPAFIVNITTTVESALTVQNIHFRDQEAMSIQFQNSVNPVNILNNRFTGNIPLTLPGGAMGRFAVGVAGIGPFAISNLVTVEDNYIDWSDYPHNDLFVGDDNGFAFAAGNMSVIIRNNFINSLGEAIEVEGNFGQENTYLVEGNVVQTLVPPSPSGESNGSPGSVAEGVQGGHPAAVKVHANEGTFIVRDNEISLTGLSFGVCMMATTLNATALAGEQVNIIENNSCSMTGQLAAILGAWGQSSPFYEAASLSGTFVAGNVISGAGAVGIAMINRTAAPLQGTVVNDGHNNHFRLNNFSGFTATNADIGFDSQTTNNVVSVWLTDNIIDLGDNNRILDKLVMMPLIFGK